ncbi:MAG: hypothetical protein KTR31_01110, partial [Myxococcales bacterium]|nr:hypothetical protein [Myxococcales bacterium]
DNDFVQELHCAVADVGSFSLPGELWTEWVPGRTVQVLFGRYNGGNGLLPWNRGRIAVASQVWYYGAAISE